MKTNNRPATPSAASELPAIEEVWGTRPAEPWELAMEEHAAQVAAAASAWLKRWPAHCKKCGGWGGSSYEESHGFRGGGTETIFDLCDALPDSHTCHRCGCAGLGAEGEGPCGACGWNYDDGVPS